MCILKCLKQIKWNKTAAGRAVPILVMWLKVKTDCHHPKPKGKSRLLFNITAFFYKYSFHLFFLSTINTLFLTWWNKDVRYVTTTSNVLKIQQPLTALVSSHQHHPNCCYTPNYTLFQLFCQKKNRKWYVICVYHLSKYLRDKAPGG